MSPKAPLSPRFPASRGALRLELLLEKSLAASEFWRRFSLQQSLISCGALVSLVVFAPTWMCLLFSSVVIIHVFVAHYHLQALRMMPPREDGVLSSDQREP